MTTALDEQLRDIGPYRYRGELTFKLEHRPGIDPTEVFYDLFLPPELWGFEGSIEEFFEGMPWFFGLNETNRTRLLSQVRYMAHSAYAASPIYIRRISDNIHVLCVETHLLAVLQEEVSLLAKRLTSKGFGYRLCLHPEPRGGPIGRVFEYSLASSDMTALYAGTQELPRRAVLFTVYSAQSLWSLFVNALYKVGAVTLLVKVVPDFYTEYQKATPEEAVATTVLALLSTATIALIWSVIQYYRMRRRPSLIWESRRKE